MQAALDVLAIEAAPYLLFLFVEGCGLHEIPRWGIHPYIPACAMTYSISFSASNYECEDTLIPWSRFVLKTKNLNTCTDLLAP